MKKTLLVSAVATAMAVSGSAYAGSAADGLYGKIRLGLQNRAELDLVSGKLVFGFKGSEDLGNGLTASYGIELEGDSADQETTNFSNDKSWVGLSGGFGKVVAGEHSDMAWWACSGTDLFYHGTAEACSLGHNTSPANSIQYRGGAGALNFGFSMDFDNTGESGSLVGLQFDGGAFKVGGQFVTASDVAPLGGVAAGDSGSAIGGTYTLGNDMTFGVTIGDNGSAADSGGTDIGFQMPLGGGNLAVVASTVDTVNGDSIDLAFTSPLGGGAFWAVEFTDNDSALDTSTTLMLGMNF